MKVSALITLLMLRAVSAACPSAELLNSYQNVSVTDPEVAQLAKLAAQAYISNASSPHVRSCHHGGGGSGSGGALQLDGPQTVEAACGQLVAGMNYDITFSQRLHCGSQAPVTVVLEALAFVPLPLAGQNGPPQINFVTEVG